MLLENCVRLLNKIMLRGVNINNTEWRILPYKRVPFKKYSYLDSIRICSLNISSQNALRVANSGKLSAKKHNLKVYANYVECKLTPHRAVVLA